MAESIARVKVNDKPLKNLVRRLRGRSGAIDKMLKQWGIVYLAAMRRRFRNFSRGGGNWPPLAEATIIRKGSSSILIDVGALFAALSPGAPGNTFKRTRSGILVGMVSGGNHPNAGISLAELADIHHTGKGNNPERPIIESPNQQVINQFIKIASKAITDSAKGR